MSALRSWWRWAVVVVRSARCNAAHVDTWREKTLHDEGRQVHVVYCDICGSGFARKLEQ